ncbi:MAG TPA: DNA polymerase III subunit [Rheinheimera sp.]|nr:DNA polymerase III subunit [Rheinheimera sp.]
MLPAWLATYQRDLADLQVKQQLAHGILFTGVEGVGKDLLAQWLAAFLLCTTELQRPCHKCKSCLLRIAGSHSDLLVIDASGTTIGVDAIRQLSVFMQGRAQQQANKVVILPSAHKLTEAAANALLKTLEEPPQNSYLILHTHAQATLPSTVLSRCQLWPVAAQFGADTQQWLSMQSGKTVPDFLLAYCAGGPLKALSLIETEEVANICAALEALKAFFNKTLSLAECIKILETSTDLSRLFGWFIRYDLLAAGKITQERKILAVHQLYNRWCRDAVMILGQNKQLSLSALLTELDKLQS